MKACILLCFVHSFIALETIEEMKASKEAVKDYVADWEYELLSKYEPKPLNLAFQHFLIQYAGVEGASQFYNELKRSGKLITPDMKYFAENINWLKSFVRDAEHRRFVKNITELENMRFLSMDRLPGMDQTTDCWVILAYNSTQKRNSDITLAKSMLDHFNEKCQVGVYDYSFPSNYRCINQLMVGATRMPGASILLRYPNAIMTNTRFLPQYWGIDLLKVGTWGEVLYPFELETMGDHLVRYIENAIYTKMSNPQKIEAIYNVFDNDPSKKMMKEIIFEYQRNFKNQLTSYVDKKVRFDSEANEYDPESLQAAYPDIIRYQDELADTQSLESYIEHRLTNATYTNRYDYDVPQITRIMPKNTQEL